MSALRGKSAAWGVVAVLSLATAGCAHHTAATASGADAGGSPVSAGTERGGLLSLGRGRMARAPATAPNGIGVNAYLWRATLDTLAFMPLASADPFGGVIITDWYSNPEKPTERFKATVYILDTRLRADGLNVSVFKQVKDGAGQWADSPVAGQTDIDIENSILTKARQLKLSNISGRG